MFNNFLLLPPSRYRDKKQWESVWAPGLQKVPRQPGGGKELKFRVSSVQPLIYTETLFARVVSDFQIS